MDNYTPNKFEFKFTACDGTVNIRIFSKEMLPDVLEEMELFLKGCGFFFNGTLDIIDEEEPTIQQKDPIIHSQHYYDFNRNRS